MARNAVALLKKFFALVLRFFYFFRLRLLQQLILMHVLNLLNRV